MLRKTIDSLLARLRLLAISTMRESEYENVEQIA